MKDMKFQVVNDKGSPVMETEHISCIPDYSSLSSMSKAGYKFKVDGKIINLKKIKEMTSENDN
ncbi:MAG: hypothetical protein PUB94_06125 [Oscillospiraceae bacterium]|nr:hypothetical protein [Oscillospiraceae bacterium]